MNISFGTTLLRIALPLSLASVSAHALELDYAGEFTFCTATCNTFDALGAESGGAANPINSSVTGFIDLPVSPEGTFEFSQSDNVLFDFAFSNAAVDALPAVIGPDASCAPPNVPGQICNFDAANPLPLNNVVGRVSGSGVIGSNGLPQSGTLTFTWRASPLSSNGIALRLDLADQSGSATLFGGAIAFFEFDGAFGSDDSDGDGLADLADNCINAPNADQRDTDGDGYGNGCDADLNNDCIVNFQDLGLLRTVFFSSDDDADFNGDNLVNFVDLGVLRGAFFAPPGPSAQTEVCLNP